MHKILDDTLYTCGFYLFDHDIKAEVVPEGIYRYPDLVAAQSWTTNTTTL